MDKEKILEMSRKENKGKELYELEINKKGADAAATAAIVTCFIFYVTDWFLYHKENPILKCVIFSMFGAAMLYKGVKLKSKPRIIMGIISMLAAITIISTTIYTAYLEAKYN